MLGVHVRAQDCRREHLDRVHRVPKVVRYKPEHLVARAHRLLHIGQQPLVDLFDADPLRHIPQDNGIDGPVCRGNARDGGLGRELVTVLPPADDDRALAHPARGDCGVIKTFDVPVVRLAKPARKQHMNGLAEDFIGRVAEDVNGAVVEERDALGLVHADDAIARDRQDANDEGVGKSIHERTVWRRAGRAVRDSPTRLSDVLAEISSISLPCGAITDGKLRTSKGVPSVQGPAPCETPRSTPPSQRHVRLRAGPGRAMPAPPSRLAELK